MRKTEIDFAVYNITEEQKDNMEIVLNYDELDSFKRGKTTYDEYMKCTVTRFKMTFIINNVDFLFELGAVLNALGMSSDFKCKTK